MTGQHDEAVTIYCIAFLNILKLCLFHHRVLGLLLDTGGQGGASSTILRVDPEQLEQEVADLQEECMRAAQNKNAIEEEYLKQIIAVSTRLRKRPQLTGSPSRNVYISWTLQQTALAVTPSSTSPQHLSPELHRAAVSSAQPLTKYHPPYLERQPLTPSYMFLFVPCIMY